MKKPVLWILQIVAAVALGFVGIQKLIGAAPPIELFESIGMEPTGRIITGVLELSAGIMLLIPSSGAYGAILAVGVMCGAIIGHLSVIGVEGQKLMMFVMAIALLSMNSAIIYLRRAEILIVRDMFARDLNQ